MRILIALDRSEYAEIVLEHGLDQAMQHPDAELHVATATTEQCDEDFVRSALDAGVRRALDDFGQANRSFTVHVVNGRPAAAICALADRLGADLLVIGRFHVPSEADAFLSRAACPTMVVGPDGVELEPQCPECVQVRRESHAERLFCAKHHDRMPELVSRVHASDVLVNRRWWL
jgi:nucleotide-binding universal stress UspA family protein